MLAAREELAVLQDALNTARSGVDAAAESFREATGAVDALAARRSSLREREAEGENRAAQLADRLAGLDLALQAREAEAAELKARLAALAGELTDGRAATTAREQDEARAAGALATCRAEEEARRRVALERLGEQNEWSNRRAESDARHGAAAAGLARIAARVGELGRQMAEAEQLQEELASGARTLADTLGARRRVLDELSTERAAAARRGEQLDGELSAAREKLAGLESRRTALAELLARHEGLSPGARTLLESDLPGIEGLIVDRLRAPRALAEAVEAALGATAEAVLVGSRADGVRALEHLRQRGAGRVLLLPRDAVRPRPASPAGAPGEPLLDRVKALSDADVLAALLGHVRLVPDLATLQSCPLDGTTVWVTPQGDLLDERGVLRGGRVGGEGGLVTRRAECDALEGDVATLRTSASALAAERQQAGEALAALDGRRQVLETELARLTAESERTAEAGRQGEARRRELQRDLDLTRVDEQAVAAERDAQATARIAAESRLAELAALVEADAAAESRASQKHAALEHALQSSRAALSEARIAFGALTEREQAQAAELRQVERAHAERAADRERAVAERDELAAARRALREELDSLDGRERELTEARDAAAGDLAEARSRVAAVQERLSAGQSQVTAAEAAAGAASDAVSAFRLREQENAIHRGTLRDKALEELAIDLEQGLPPEALAAPAEAEPPAVEGEEGETGVEGEAPAPVAATSEDGPTDWDAVEQEIETLRDRMARMGNVNLAAVDELREVDERLSFLVTQRDDLLAAKATLEDTIRKVDAESRERFTATFQEVAGHFRTIFRKLFRGGKAEVALAEGQDVLEAGIDIVAGPPGKDPRSISLLSGGERTLTAVGLLFALFRARPSPVCMLDEVDAALDETNIDRFCTVLEDFLSGSQFLVVTHARRTMSYADTLYGITMQEHGVSRALSLTLREYDEQADVGNAGGAEAPVQRKAPPPPSRIANELAAEG